MAVTGPQISGLLEKMMSTDKDFRFMATNDLMAELQKDSIKLDDEIERRITKALLKLLDDKNGEVQNLAVKCLSPLIAKAKPHQIELVVESLCQNIDSDQDRLRDVSSIALKTVVNELSLVQHAKQISLIIAKVLPKLLNNLKEEKRTDSSIKIEIADILGIIVAKFGRQNDINFNAVEDVLFLLIKRERQALRKRAITVLGYLVGTVQDEAYERIALRVLEGLKTEKDPNALRAYVLAAATISKSSTRLFVGHLAEFVGSLVSFCKETEDDELKDACVHAFETFIVRCNKEITPYLPAIVEICSNLIVHDPNYAYDSDDGENGEAMEVDSDAGSDDEFNEYSDDDDLSWKARRAAAKCFEALILNRSDRLLEHYKSIAPLLLGRFKEREESVKFDIFHAYEALLKQTRLFLPEKLANLDSVFNTDGNKDATFSMADLQRILSEEVDEHQRLVLEAGYQQVPQIIRAISKQIKSKSPTVRLQCFALLISLVRALPGSLNDHFDSLIPSIKASILEKSADSSTKIDTLNFLNLCFCSHEPSVFYSHLDTLIPLIVNCANEPFYKVGSVALTVLQSLIMKFETSSNFLPYVEQIYEVLVSKLRLNDIDQEVKERAISAAGMLLTCAKLDHHWNEILPILFRHLQNEMTRQIAVQSFSVIAASDQVNLSSIVNELLLQLADFLRKNQRALKVSTLTLLSRLVNSGQIGTNGLELAIAQLPSMICADQDMHIAQLAMKLTKEVIVKFPQAIAPHLNAVITSCINSSLVGRSLEFATELFVAIVQSPIQQKPNFENLMTQLTAQIYAEKTSRQVCHSIAFIMAHSTKANNNVTTTTKLLKGLCDSLKKQTDNDSIHIFSLYALGEIGRIYPTAFEVTKINPWTLIIEFFSSSVEEVKMVASYSLGALSAGDIKYLPALLQEIKTQPKIQYLLLHSLKEVIISGQNVEAQLNEIWNVLLSHSKAPEESVRNTIGECLGKLLCLESRFLPQLVAMSRNGNSLERGTVSTAVRFMLVGSSNDQYLRDNLLDLIAIDDEDLNVRKSAVMSISAISHNKPKLIKDFLPALLPSIYRETVINQSLIKSIEMGPFKHEVDGGLDLRKATYECLYTLVDQIGKVDIDVLEFLDHVEIGLKDQHDIALLNLLMLNRLAQIPQLVQRIDSISESIMGLLQLKARPNSVKQESEKLDELKRSAVRTVVKLRQEPELQRSPKLTLVYDFISNEPILQAMIKDE